MFVDNRNTYEWAGDVMITDGNQHFDKRYFTIRERVDEGEIMPVWVAGADNPADVGTKPIDGPTTAKHVPVLRGQRCLGVTVYVKWVSTVYAS